MFLSDRSRTSFRLLESRESIFRIYIVDEYERSLALPTHPSHPLTTIYWETPVKKMISRAAHYPMLTSDSFGCVSVSSSFARRYLKKYVHHLHARDLFVSSETSFRCRVETEQVAEISSFLKPCIHPYVAPGSLYFSDSLSRNRHSTSYLTQGTMSVSIFHSQLLVHFRPFFCAEEKFRAAIISEMLSFFETMTPSSPSSTIYWCDSIKLRVFSTLIPPLPGSMCSFVSQQEARLLIRSRDAVRRLK